MKTTQDRILGLHLSFLMTVHTIFSSRFIIIWFFLFNVIWTCLNFAHFNQSKLFFHVILLTSIVEVFVLLTGFELGPRLLRSRHSTPRLLKPMKSSIRFVAYILIRSDIFWIIYSFLYGAGRTYIKFVYELLPNVN